MPTLAEAQMISLKEGYLYKKKADASRKDARNVKKGWDRRYFSLSMDGRLRYYLDKEKDKMKVRASMWVCAGCLV